MADIFISYKSDDREWANKLDTLIKSAGYTTWWDTSLMTGQKYNDCIDKELRAAKAAIVIWSERSWASAWVKEEALFARDQEKLLPIRIDNVSIGVPFYSLHTIDFQLWDGRLDSSEANSLVESLNQFIPKKLKKNFSVDVFWTRFNDEFMNKDENITRILSRVKTVCSSIGVNINIIKAWDNIVNPHTIKDRSVYEQDINIFLFFGSIKIDGFADDVFCPGLRRFAKELNPYVIHIGNKDFSLDLLNFYCAPQRKVELKDESFPEQGTMREESLIDALAHHISFKVLRVQSVLS
jgi:hypothetical protein